MATASHPVVARAAAEPSRTPPAGRARRLLPAAVTTVAVAVAVKLVYGPWFLNYDARYALLWARDVSRGLTPDYDAPFAPTPHPLSTAWSALALPFGDSGDRVIVWLTLLAFGALVYLAYRLGAELFTPAAGVVAAIVVLTRPAITRDTLLGYQDLPFACLVVGAVLAEVRRPRRGTLPLVLLAIAGLLRPEAWVLGGLYWLYVARDLGWGARIRLAALVVAGPVLWLLMDLIVTGDALHSLHGTSELAAENGRRRHLSQVPLWTVKYFGAALREPMAVAIPLGLLFAYRQRRRRALLPLAVVVAMVAVFAASPIFGLPLISRYLRTPAVLLALFAGPAVVGWTMVARPRERRLWQAAAVLSVLASLVYLPWHARELHSLQVRMDRFGAMYADLRQVARAPALRAAVARCGTVATSDHRPVPYLRYWLGGDPGSVTTLEHHAGRGRILLLPRPSRPVRAFYRANLPRRHAPAGYQRIYRDRSWKVLAAPGCA